MASQSGVSGEVFKGRRGNSQSPGKFPSFDRPRPATHSTSQRRHKIESVTQVVQIIHAQRSNQAADAEEVPTSALKPSTQPLQRNQASEKRENRPE